MNRSMMAPFMLGAILIGANLAGCGEQKPDFDPNTVVLAPNGKPLPTGQATPAPSAAQMALLPFEGSWGRTSADCDLSRDDRRGTLKIEKGRVDYYAAGGPIERIVAYSPSSITVDLRLTGFGQAAMVRTNYTLRVAGTRLLRTDGSPPAQVEYTRC